MSAMTSANGVGALVHQRALEYTNGSDALTKDLTSTSSRDRRFRSLDAHSFAAAYSATVEAPLRASLMDVLIRLSRCNANDWQCATDDGSRWGFEPVFRADVAVRIGVCTSV
jgi:hypothetical protein